MISANLTLDVDAQNISLVLHSARGSILAKGKFKNTPRDKYLEAVLDINNRKHLDISMSLEEVQSHNGRTYIPKFYLGVNSERVAELDGMCQLCIYYKRSIFRCEFLGSLKLASKSGVAQWDVDLKFQTKRLMSKLFGYVSIQEMSIGTNLKLDYRFVNTQEQRVTLDFEAVNRSTRNLAALLGHVRVETTSYPHFNFDAAVKYQVGT